MRIAIVKLSALGDIVHSMVVLQFIKKFNKEISIDWFVEDDYKELLEFHPDINQVHSLNLRKAKKKKSLSILIEELNRLRKLSPYDVVIDMQGLIKSAIVGRLIPSQITVGFDENSIRESIASRFYSHKIKVKYSENIVMRNLILISNSLENSIINYDVTNKKPFLFSNVKYFFKSEYKTKRRVALIPGASFKSKCYPIKKYAKFVNEVDANFFVIWGNQNEKKMANELKSSSQNVEIINKLSIHELISFISQMDLVVGSDTGPTHMAWALNIPSITLFGPTPGNRNSFETETNKYIESKSKVNALKIDKSDNSIKDINVEDIVKIARNLLKAI